MATSTNPRRITSKGQVTLPIAWRKKTKAQSVVMTEKNGVLQIRPARQTKRGDVVIVTAGSPPGMPGTTNMVRVHHIGEDDAPKA